MDDNDDPFKLSDDELEEISDEIEAEREERAKKDKEVKEKQKVFTITCCNCGANVNLMETVIAGLWNRSIEPIKLEVNHDGSMEELQCTCGNKLNMG